MSEKSETEIFYTLTQIQKIYSIKKIAEVKDKLIDNNIVSFYDNSTKLKVNEELLNKNLVKIRKIIDKGKEVEYFAYRKDLIIRIFGNLPKKIKYTNPLTWKQAVRNIEKLNFEFYEKNNFFPEHTLNFHYHEILEIDSIPVWNFSLFFQNRFSEILILKDSKIDINLFTEKLKKERRKFMKCLSDDEAYAYRNNIDYIQTNRKIKNFINFCKKDN